MVFDFGDGTTFEGDSPPPHEYCHRGYYSFSMVASGEDWSATYPQLISIFSVELPPADVLLNMGETGTEFHAVNLLQVSFERRYQTLGRVYAVTHDDDGRVAFDGELAVEITPPPGGANGDDPAPTQVPLVEGDDRIYEADLENDVHDFFPPYLVDGEPFTTQPATFLRINNGEYDIDLPLCIEPFPALGEPLTLGLFREANSPDDVRYVFRRDNDVWAFDAQGDESTVTLTVEQLEEIGPGLVEVWAVSTSRFAAQNDPEVIFASSYIEGKTIILTDAAPEE